MKLTIRVTEKHIKDGVKGNCAACPVALAIQDTCELAKSVSAGNLLIFAESSKAPHYYQAFAPAEVEWFMTDFDRGRPVEPFTFSADFVLRENHS